MKIKRDDDDDDGVDDDDDDDEDDVLNRMFLFCRTFAALNLASAVGNASWDTPTRITFVFAQLVTQEKTAKQVTQYNSSCMLSFSEFKK